ncbi:acyl carrier protein [Cellulosilyticum ruminicola]|uniref:acyl carrier protein n=1 Tax=Cellulosilyticum ruminicola TaxID=425254 RepID=UPI0006D09F92|nr:acyl carrier protein [Cellulosilyticum ruminicola]
MKEKIKEILVEVSEKPELMEALQGDFNIIEEVGLDSLQMINFILRVEDEFDVEIDFDEFDYDNLQSVSSFCEFLKNQ